MSKTIDQRVVEMRFDNSHFEKNVSTTLSTLDKLKSKLNFSKSAKGLEEVNSAANKVNMNGLASGIQDVHAKFSALQIAGITCMQRITNAAITAGKNIVSSLTVQPVTTGFNEYELKMNSVQTIMASTGESLETVNKHLEALNKYSDDTIYSFSDMTQNIGKFTNAGVKLEDAVLAIKGISNEAALSGANANEASRAMYNFAQALSSGYVKLIDWKSIENANMATVGFKEQLIETAVEMKTLTKTTDGFKTAEGTVITATKNFNDSLQDQWMTSDVLIKTLQKYADTSTEIGRKATQAATEVKTFSQMMDTLKESAQSGWAQSWEIIFGDFYEGKSLWTGINEAIGGILDTMSTSRNNWLTENLTNDSKWNKLEEQLKDAGVSVEKFEEKLVSVSKENGIAVDDLIEKYGTFRKAITTGKIPIELFSKALRSISGATDGIADSTQDLNEKLEYFQKIVDDVWSGKYKNGTERMKLLTAAGYEYAVVQDLVNKAENGHKLTLEDLTDVQLEHIGYTKEQIKKINELADEADKAGTPLNELIAALTKPTGRDLLIDSFKNIWDYISKFAGFVGNAWNNVFGDGDPSKNFSLYTIIEEFKKLTDALAFTEEESNRLTNILTGIFSAIDITYSLATYSTLGVLRIINEILKLFGTDVGKILEHIALKITEFQTWIDDATIFGADTKWKDLAEILIAVYNGISKCIKAFMDITIVKNAIEKIGHAISFVLKSIGIDIDGIDITNVVKGITSAFETLSKSITKFGLNTKFITQVKEIAETISNSIIKLYFNLSNVVGNIFDIFYYLILGIKKIFMGDDFVVPGENIVDGLVKGLTNGIKNIWKVMMTLANTVIDIFCSILGINSPSKVFIAIGGFIIAGLIHGLANDKGKLLEILSSISTSIVGVFEDLSKNSLPYISDLVKTLASNLLNTFKKMETIDLGSLVILGGTVGLGLLGKKLIGVLDKLATPIKSLGDIMKNISKVIDEVGESIERYSKAKSWEAYSKSLLNVALAIGILAAALIALTRYVNFDNLWKSIGAIAALAAIMVVLAVALEKINGASITLEKGKGLQFDGLKTGMISIAIALLAMAAVVKILGSMDWKQGLQGVVGLIILTTLLTTFFKTYGIAMKSIDGESIKRSSAMMRSMAITLLLMVAVVKLMGGMTPEEINQGTSGILAFLVFALSLVGISAIPSKNIDKVGNMMLSIAGAMLLMIAAIKLFNTLKPEEISKGTAGIFGFTVVVAVLVAITKLGGTNLDKLGRTVIALSGALLMLTVCMKILGSMDFTQIANAAVGLFLLTGIIFFLVQIMNMAMDAPKMAGTLLALSLALLILVGVAAIAGSIPIDSMINGIAVVGLLSVFMSMMIFATRGANDCKGNLIVMVIAIGILTACVAALGQLTPEQLWGPTAALALLMGMFALMTYAASNVTGSIPILITMVIAVGLLGVILYALAQLPVDNVLGSAIGLSVLLLAMSAALLILAAVGTFIAPVYAGLIALGILIVAIGAVLIAIGALEEPLTKGIEVLEKLGTGFGKAIGNFIGGIAEGITDSLPAIAENLSNFMSKLNPFIQGVSNIGDAFKTGMTNFSEGLGAISLMSLAKLDNIGEQLEDFSNYAVNIDSNAIINSVSLTESIVKAVNNLGSIKPDAIAKFKSVISDLCETNISELTSSFSSASDNFADIGTNIVNAITNSITDVKSKYALFKAGSDSSNEILSGIRNETMPIINTVKTMMESVIKVVNDCFGDFYDAGKNMVTGFASGISVNTYEAYAKAKAMAKMALQGAKEELDINSPSKEGYSIGDFFGLGFVNAIKNYADKAYGASSTMAKSAEDGLSGAINKIKNSISDNIDTQPTIRPVLDLSDIKSGASSIASIFGSNQSIGLAGSINTMMNQRQNGTNDDVVSAINKLNNKLDKVGNTYNSINGITYDDGSNISDAIKTLVRAVTVEGRT